MNNINCNNKMTVVANELVVVYQNDKQEKIINARELHEFLGSQRQFSDWIKDRIIKYGFVENEDFSFHKIVEANPSGKGVQTRIEYFLQLDCAKEIAMVENNEQGRKVRKYFIEVERKAREYSQQQQQQAQHQYVLPKNFHEALVMLADSVKQNEQLTEQLDEAQPKAEFYDNTMHRSDLMTATQLAADYGMTAANFNALLKFLGVQWKHPRRKDNWCLRVPYLNNGYTHTKTYKYGVGVQTTMCWTQKGREFLHWFLKDSCGLLPLAEK